MLKAEDRELITAWRERGDERAFKKLLDKHKAIIRNQSKKYLNNGRVSIEDMEQEGAIGLFKALEKFDVNKGIGLKSYTQWFTMNEIGNHGRPNSTSVKIPQGHMNGISKIIWDSWSAHKAQNRNTDSQEYVLSDEQIIAKIAAENDITVNKVTKIINSRQVSEKNVDAPMMMPDGEAEAVLPEPLIDRQTAENEIINAESETGINIMVKKLMKALTDREKDIIIRRRFQNQTLEQVSLCYDVSRERIRQIEVKAMEKLALAGAGMRGEAAEYLSGMHAG